MWEKVTLRVLEGCGIPWDFQKYFFPSSMDTFLVVVYYYVYDVFTNGDLIQINYIFPTMDMQVDAIYYCFWNYRYITYKSILITDVYFFSNFSLMAEIMWIIYSRNNAYKHGCRVPFNAITLIYFTGGPSKDQSRPKIILFIVPWFDGWNQF